MSLEAMSVPLSYRQHFLLSSASSTSLCLSLPLPLYLSLFHKRTIRMVSLPGISASDRPNVGRQDAGATGGRGRDNEEERRRGSLRDNRAVANTTRESPWSFMFTAIARCVLAAFTSQLSIPHVMKYPFYSEKKKSKIINSFLQVFLFRRIWILDVSLIYWYIDET